MKSNRIVIIFFVLSIIAFTQIKVFCKNYDNNDNIKESSHITYYVKNDGTTYYNYFGDGNWYLSPTNYYKKNTYNKGNYQVVTYDGGATYRITAKTHFTDAGYDFYSLAVYPNPVQNILNLKAYSLHTEYADIFFQNILGNRFFLMKVKLTEGENIFKLDLSNFEKGFYNVFIISDKNIYRNKIVIE